MSELSQLGTFLKTERRGVTTEMDTKVNALAPYSGYMNWKEGNFYFNTSTSFLASIADKNRYVKFGDKVVDTYGSELVTNGDFSDGTTGWITDGSISNGVLNISTVASTSYLTLSSNKTYIIKVSNINCQNLVLKYKTSTSSFVTFATITTLGVTEIIISTPTLHLTGYLYLYGTGSVDNISVREIQTKSALDFVPEVTVLDQATYGLTTQSSVLAGDYVVVDRKELVTNGTFDSDTSGWTAVKSTIASISGKLRITLTDVDGGAYQFIPTVIGKKYIIELDTTFGTNTDISIRAYIGTFTTLLADKTTTVQGRHTLEFTATATSTMVYVMTRNLVGKYCDFDNISVKQLDEVYRAKIDAPSGTLLTNTTYFKVRDNLPISNQIAFLHTMDATTKAYEGISNEILFNDALATETPKAIMLKNGFSEVSKGLYSKGSKLYVFAGYWQTLNKGAYHPVFNIAGTKASGDSTTRAWYASTIDSISDAITNISTHVNFGQGTYQGTTQAVVGVSYDKGLVTYDGTNYVLTRPDGKYYDVIYENQFISFNHSELAYKPTDSEKKRIREYEKYRGVEGSYIGYAQAFTPIQKGTDSSQVFIELGISNNFITYGDNSSWSTTTVADNNIVLIDASGVVHKNVFAGFSANGRYLHWVEGYSNTAIVDINGTCLITSKKQIPFNSKGTSLTTDLIGNPTNYPTIMKDRLIEGKGIFGINPLLVSDTGISYINTTSLTSIKLSKKANPLPDTMVYTTDNGLTYSYASSRSISSINNTVIPSYGSAGRLSIFSYISQNNPYQATTPKAVASVEPKVIASNSHSIYKGAIVGNCIGKVQVGNGSNWYESKVLENSEIIPPYNLVLNGSLYVKTNDIVFIASDGFNAYPKGSYVRAINDADSPSIPYNNSFSWASPLGTTYMNRISNPSHSPIALDNANSPASKWFEGTCYDDDYEYPFVVIQGVDAVNNGDTGNFGNLTNGTVTDWNGDTQTTKFMIGTPIARRD